MTWQTEADQLNQRMLHAIRCKDWPSQPRAAIDEFLQVLAREQRLMYPLLIAPPPDATEVGRVGGVPFFENDFMTAEDGRVVIARRFQALAANLGGFHL